MSSEKQEEEWEQQQGRLTGSSREEVWEGDNNPATMDENKGFVNGAVGNKGEIT